MNSKEYVIWLKGFVEACNDYAPTPKQWDTMKEELEKISDAPKLINTSIGTTSTPGFAVTTNPEYGSITYNPSTTTQMYPSGAAWHYTNS